MASKADQAAYNRTPLQAGDPPAPRELPGTEPPEEPPLEPDRFLPDRPIETPEPPAFPEQPLTPPIEFPSPPAP